MSVVLDASALLAMLNSEPGAETVYGVLVGAAMSAVNYSEVVAKLADKGHGDGEAFRMLEALPLAVHPFDAAQAWRAGLLRGRTRARGLSLGDRACLALAIDLELTALTADRAWAELDVGVEILVVR